MSCAKTQACILLFFLAAGCATPPAKPAPGGAAVPDFKDGEVLKIRVQEPTGAALAGLEVTHHPKFSGPLGIPQYRTGASTKTAANGRATLENVKFEDKLRIDFPGHATIYILVKEQSITYGFERGPNGAGYHSADAPFDCSTGDFVIVAPETANAMSGSPAKTIAPLPDFKSGAPLKIRVQETSGAVPVGLVVTHHSMTRSFSALGVPSYDIGERTRTSLEGRAKLSNVKYRDNVHIEFTGRPGIIIFVDESSVTYALQGMSSAMNAKFDCERGEFIIIVPSSASK